ncbi:hypothetical protein M900_A0357 [Bacteriovorax sp. Seq25_V]|nr:hypothetical protein M900_A0357 [Bacteriovorax sp. Seq25_V]
MKVKRKRPFFGDINTPKKLGSDKTTSYQLQWPKWAKPVELSIVSKN